MADNLASIGQRFAWLQAVARARTTATALRVAVAIAAHMNAARAEAWPSLRTIAAWCGIEKRNASAAVRALEREGLLVVAERGGPRRSRRYRMPEVSEETLLRCVTARLCGVRGDAAEVCDGTPERGGKAERKRSEPGVGARARAPLALRAPRAARLRSKPSHPRSETPAMLPDLEGELRRRRRLPNGHYVAPEPMPYDKADDHAALAAALAEPPDPEHAAEAARHLIESFPNCRVGKAAYSEGLADIVADEGIPPCVVRYACRRVRAEAKSLPPLADLRERMFAEVCARGALLIGLDSFPRKLAEGHKHNAAEAERIAARAARHGATLPPSDIVPAWQAIADGWLHNRINLSAMRAGEDFGDGDCLIAALETGRPPEAFQAAAALVPDLAAYERARNAALATAPKSGTPEGDAWYLQWPDPAKEFADRIAPIVAAFRQAHRL
jgi:DNA-binding transcriptional ArsR family regulator